MNTPRFLSLFEAFGVELEYMIVGNETLDVKPIADAVLHAVAGSFESEVELGDIAWSNELALHVIELKTNGPAPSLSSLTDRFHEHVNRINALLEPLAARLMPTAMHPWMDPHQELKLWPHEHNAVYEAFNRIFDCRGHGWANLQSVHLNLPFANDTEFGQLHAAIRLVLPLLPALAASSPIVDGQPTDVCDSRLLAYQSNAIAIPSVTGRVIPEAVFSHARYDQVIFQPMYAAVAPYDPQGILQHEWLNARGAIARFDRQTIEIRVLDVQECPAADLAICAATVGVLRALVAQKWSTLAEQQAMPVEPLASVLARTIRSADEAVIEQPEYLRLFGLPHRSTITAGQLWQYLLEATVAWQPGGPGPWEAALQTIMRQGPLARRILQQTGQDSSRERLRDVYSQLSDCLSRGEMFLF